MRAAVSERELNCHRTIFNRRREILDGLQTKCVLSEQDVLHRKYALPLQGLLRRLRGSPRAGG
jgi:hypothetical protein